MSDHDQTPDEDLAEARSGYTLNGETLRKWSMSRVNASDSMGRKFPMIGEQGWADFETNGRYPGMRKDAAIILWLCSIEDTSDLTKETRQNWTPEKAFANPVGALAEAMIWLERQPFGDDLKPEFLHAANLACAIAVKADGSAFTVHIENGGTGEKKEENTDPAGTL